MSTVGRWYWFKCMGASGCGWKGVRYRNAKTCARCKGPLKRLRKAVSGKPRKVQEGKP